MKNLIRNITSNILLMVAGFLACLTGNWLLGLIIGAGAGILNCVFRGSLKAGGWKDTLIVAAPASIVVGVICAFGAGFCNNSIIILNFLTTIVVVALCGVVGSFMGNSKFYSEKEGTSTTPTPNEFAAQRPTPNVTQPGSSQSSTTVQPNAVQDDMLAQMMARLQQNHGTATVDSDYDAPIDTTGRDSVYYDTVRALTGEQVVTKRVIDKAYGLLPDNYKQQYGDSQKEQALIAYAYSKRVNHEDVQDSAFAQKVKELSGMNEVTEASIQKAYNTLSPDILEDLPNDPTAAIVLLSQGKTLQTIMNEEAELNAKKEAEDAKEIETYYSLIPANRRHWLPNDHKEAVRMFKAGEYLNFYNTLPQELRLNVPEYIVKLLVPSTIAEDQANEWLHINRGTILAEFCDELPEPLCYIPVSSLINFIPSKFCFGRSPVDVVKENVDALKEMFDGSLGEPLCRVPIIVMWLSLEARERQTTQMKVRDVRANVDKLRKLFDPMEVPCTTMLHTMLPTTLRGLPEAEMYARLPANSDKNWLTLLSNVDTFKSVVAFSNSVNITTESNSYFAQVAPYSMLRYMIEYCTDIMADDMTDEEFWSVYQQYYDSEVLNKDLPGVLAEIPLPMLACLVENPEDLNDDNISEIASLNNYIMRNNNSLLRLFPKDRFIPSMCWSSWNENMINGIFRHMECEDVAPDEVWRLWLPRELYSTPYEKLYKCCPGVENAPNPDLYILQHTADIMSILSNVRSYN